MTRNGFFKILEKAAAKAGVAEVHPHLLRHGTGFKLVNDGLDTLSLAAYLGHANIQNTKRYAKMDARRFDGRWRTGREVSVHTTLNPERIKLAFRR